MIQIINQTGFGVVVFLGGGVFLLLFLRKRERRCKGGKHWRDESNRLPYTDEICFQSA